MTQLPIWIRDRHGMAFSDFPVKAGGRVPDFCIIGAPKCGTTALHAMLDRQPAFCMSEIKEPHFFSTPAMLERGQEWYQGLFSTATPDQICGEASASYTRYPTVDGTAERIAATKPDMKFIYLIREPVARTESDCLQTVKYAKEVLGEDHTHMALDAFFEMIEDPSHPYYSAIFSTSCYVDQIEAFEAHFPAQNLLILMQGDLKRDPQGVLGRICGFLDVDPGSLIEAPVDANVTSNWMAGLDRRRSAEKFQKVPFYRSLKSMVPAPVKSTLLKMAANDVSASAQLRFSEALKADLRDRFRGPNRRLAERLGGLPDTWAT